MRVASQKEFWGSTKNQGDKNALRGSQRNFLGSYGLTSTKEILMNKKLIALAVAGACVAPAAMAQTANPVTLYGRVHVTFESVEATGAGPLSRRNRVSDQASLLGVRGTEDLGGGLKAFFQLETAFKPDQNDSTFAGRNSGVGLQGGWGSVLLGRWDTPFKIATTAIDPLGDVTLGGYTAAMTRSGVRGVTGQFGRREPNHMDVWS